MSHNPVLQPMSLNQANEFRAEFRALTQDADVLQSIENLLVFVTDSGVHDEIRELLGMNLDPDVRQLCEHLLQLNDATPGQGRLTLLTRSQAWMAEQFAIPADVVDRFECWWSEEIEELA